MSKKNILLTDDGIYGEYRNGYKDSIDFFIGNDVKVKKKDTKDVPEKDVKGAEQLSELVQSFSASQPHSHETFFAELEGVENRNITVKSVLQSIWEFIKETGIWVYNFFTNKIARVDAKVKYTIQKRKINGIKTNPVKFTSSIRQLLVPNIVTSDPSWVINSAAMSLNFYSNCIDAHKLLRNYIKEKPKTPEEHIALQYTILDKIGKGITGNRPHKGIYSTEPLPANRIFNIRISPSVTSSEILTYFSASSAYVKLVSNTWTPNSGIIDKSISMLENYLYVLVKDQKNVFTLINNFANEIKRMSNSGVEISSETRKYYIWLTNLNKRLISSTLQYAIFTIEALDDFVNQGIKQNGD